MDANELNWHGVTEGKTDRRIELAQEQINKLSPEELQRVRIEECSDEKTGQRYGQAEVRRGRAVKIGGGGRNKGSRYAYQVWLVWS